MPIPNVTSEEYINWVQSLNLPKALELGMLSLVLQPEPFDEAAYAAAPGFREQLTPEGQEVLSQRRLLRNPLLPLIYTAIGRIQNKNLGGLLDPAGGIAFQGIPNPLGGYILPPSVVADPRTLEDLGFAHTLFRHEAGHMLEPDLDILREAFSAMTPEQRQTAQQWYGSQVLFNRNPERETYAEGVERGFGTMTSPMQEAARGTGYFTPTAIGLLEAPGGHRPRTPSPTNYAIPLPSPIAPNIAIRPAGAERPDSTRRLFTAPRIANFNRDWRVRPE